MVEAVIFYELKFHTFNFELRLAFQVGGLKLWFLMGL